MCSRKGGKLSESQSVGIVKIWILTKDEGKRESCRSSSVFACELKNRSFNC